MMKWVTALLAVTVVITPVTAVPAAAGGGYCKPALHRGLHNANTDENTLAAIRGAKGLGPAEIDVRLTKDHRMVLMHNAKVDATTDGTGYVRDMTLAEVRALRTEPNRARVPTFATAVKVAGRQRVKLIVELKSYNDWTPELLTTATRVASQGASEVFVGGTGHGFANNLLVRAVDGAKLYWRPGPGEVASPENVRAHGAKMVQVRSKATSVNQVLRLHRAHIRVTLRKTNDYVRARKLDVDFIMTNYPRRVKKVCQQ
jgi:glycerophosphoryl diester phosphodiesterase